MDATRHSRAPICKRFRSPGINSARLRRLAESIPWNRFLGSITVYKFGLLHHSPPAWTKMWDEYQNIPRGKIFSFIKYSLVLASLMQSEIPFANSSSRRIIWHCLYKYNISVYNICMYINFCTLYLFWLNSAYTEDNLAYRLSSEYAGNKSCLYGRRMRGTDLPYFAVCHQTIWVQKRLSDFLLITLTMYQPCATFLFNCTFFLSVYSYNSYIIHFSVFSPYEAYFNLWRQPL